VFHKVNTGCST